MSDKNTSDGRRLGDVLEKIVDGDGIFDGGEILGDYDGYDYPFKDVLCKKCDNNLFIWQMNDDNSETILICSKCSNSKELSLCVDCSLSDDN